MPILVPPVSTTEHRELPTAGVGGAGAPGDGGVEGNGADGTGVPDITQGMLTTSQISTHPNLGSSGVRFLILGWSRLVAIN